MTAERDPLAWVADELARWHSQGLARERLTREGAQSGLMIEIDGRRLVNFGSNDYLSLANDPRVIESAKAAIDRVGFGAGASSLVTGRGSLHAELEAKLCEFEGTEAALLFPTGFAANAGVIPALVGSDDVIFSDAKNHASIIDGCRLSGAELRIYRHADAGHLEEQLKAASAASQRRLIVTDSLFSMDGDLAPLPEIVELAEQFGAMVLVDEAHATGVFGKNGRGVCEQFGVEDRVTLRIGTLSKALGSAGGFVVGSGSLIEWLRNRARTYMFSTAMPEALSAAALKALEIVSTDPDRRESLLQTAAHLRNSLQSLGFNVGRSASQIIPVILGDSAKTMQSASLLRDHGCFVPGIRPPSVPSGESLLRISLTTAHQTVAISKVVTTFKELAGIK